MRYSNFNPITARGTNHLGKPLISDTAMRSMYATMQQLRAAKRDRGVTEGLSRADRASLMTQPESLHAALLSQMHRRDTLLTEGEDAMAKVATAAYFPVEVSSLHTIVCPGTGEECAAVAAGLCMKAAESARVTGPRAVTVAILRSYPALDGVLSLIQQHDLPLLVVVQTAPEARGEAQRRLMGTKVPILPVDDADAVAVCRVVQEAILRARNGWGGAVIQATRLPGAPDALAGMEQRLRIRGLLPQS
jgi:TPP-dependent pyruvate/acetoin dehydrogenase alpha subunit